MESVFTRTRHWSVHWSRRINSTPSRPISLTSILILSSHLRLGLPRGLFPTGFPTKILYALHISWTVTWSHTLVVLNLSLGKDCRNYFTCPTGVKRNIKTIYQIINYEKLALLPPNSGSRFRFLRQQSGSRDKGTHMALLDCCLYVETCSQLMEVAWNWS